ncbi:hypothetical protein GGI35DRAFT_449328 [Trichoderma velutinum]
MVQPNVSFSATICFILLHATFGFFNFLFHFLVSMLNIFHPSPSCSDIHNRTPSLLSLKQIQRQSQWPRRRPARAQQKKIPSLTWPCLTGLALATGRPVLVPTMLRTRTLRWTCMITTPTRKTATPARSRRDR